MALARWRLESLHRMRGLRFIAATRAEGFIRDYIVPSRRRLSAGPKCCTRRRDELRQRLRHRSGSRHSTRNFGRWTPPAGRGMYIAICITDHPGVRPGPRRLLSPAADSENTASINTSTVADLARGLRRHDSRMRSRTSRRNARPACRAPVRSKRLLRDTAQADLIRGDKSVVLRSSDCHHTKTRSPACMRCGRGRTGIADAPFLIEKLKDATGACAPRRSASRAADRQNDGLYGRLTPADILIPARRCRSILPLHPFHQEPRRETDWPSGVQCNAKSPAVGELVKQLAT